MSADNSTMIERRRNLLGSAYRLFYDQPVHIVRGEGVWLYDAAGNKYLDMYNNVPHVGHCHPHVVEAISKQLATLNTHTRYLHENVIELAERQRTFDTCTTSVNLGGTRLTRWGRLCTEPSGTDCVQSSPGTFDWNFSFSSF